MWEAANHAAPSPTHLCMLQCMAKDQTLADPAPPLGTLLSAICNFSEACACFRCLHKWYLKAAADVQGNYADSAFLMFLIATMCCRLHCPKKDSSNIFTLQASPWMCLQVICVPISLGLSCLYLYIRNRFLHMCIKSVRCLNYYCNQTSFIESDPNYPLINHRQQQMLRDWTNSHIISSLLFLIITNSVLICEALLPKWCLKAWTRSRNLAHKGSSGPG